MTAVKKIDSNLTELAYAQEASIGVVSSPTWYPLEPNSYGDFGGDIKTVAREPITSDRQRRKAVVTDLDGKAEFEQDFTQTNLSDMLQGFFFASFRRKVENTSVTAVDGTAHTMTLTNTGSAIRVGDLILGSGFTNAGNNVLSRVTALTSTTGITVSAGLTTEASPPATHKITVVGFQFSSGDASITNSGSAFPTLTASSKDLTQLGLLPGEWVFIGDDSNAAYSFATAANNGFARVRSVTTTTITFDKTYTDMVTDAGTSKTIRIYVGRFLKNEQAASIVRRTYQLERKLGQPDDSSSNTQSQYVVGCVPDELELDISTADKVVAKVKLMGTDTEERDAATGVKSGTRATLTAEDAFNTSSDIPHVKLSVPSSTDANPDPLFEHLSDLTVMIKNNVKGNKAVGTLGSFDMSVGNFEVSAKMTAYFANVSVCSSVRNGDALTLDVQLVKNNKGIALDIVQMVAGKSLLGVKKDEPVELPLEPDASSGVELSSSLNHTASMVFFDYLPDSAN